MLINFRRRSKITALTVSCQIYFVKMIAKVTIVLGDKMFTGILTETKKSRSKPGQKEPSVKIQVQKSFRSKIKKA
jgi:hypothetical protein